MERLSRYGRYTYDTVVGATIDALDEYTDTSSAVKHYNTIQRASSNARNDGRVVTKFGPWKLSSRQSRMGQTNGYRRNIFAHPVDLSDKPLDDIKNQIRIDAYDLRIPYVKFCNDITNSTNKLVDLIVYFHNANHLPSTMVVLPQTNVTILEDIRKVVSTIDYTINPNINTKLNIFRKNAPAVYSSMDLQPNNIVIINQEKLYKLLFDDGECYHNSTLVIIYNPNEFVYADPLKQAAKYISNYVYFLQS